MAMMDDERNRNTYNEARLLCKLRRPGNDALDICKLLHHKGTCHLDKYRECPLWVFVKAITNG